VVADTEEKRIREDYTALEEADAAVDEVRKLERQLKIARDRRNEALDAAVATGWTIAGLADRYGTKRQQIQDWVRAARSHPVPVLTAPGVTEIRRILPVRGTERVNGELKKRRQVLDDHRSKRLARNKRTAQAGDDKEAS